MPVSPEYRDWVVEQLSAAGPVTARSMFGGVGLYLDGHFFALIDDDVLYLKTDEHNLPAFEAAGMQPFRPYGDERAMRYHEVPADVLEDRAALADWVAGAVDAARRGKRR